MENKDKEAFLKNWDISSHPNAISELSPKEFAEDLLLIRQGLPLKETTHLITWWRTAAAIAAVLAIFFTFYLTWPGLQDDMHSGTLSALKVAPGQKKQLMLADGSKVWVNAGSELRYPEKFIGNTREIYLSGEAYFDVHHDPSKPFIIHTANVVTTVLGTAFNIREDKTKHTIEVTVARGRVSVANGDRMLGIITPDQQISFNTSSEKVIQQNVDALKIASWQKTDLQFEDVTFAEVAKRLEERFGVKISFANEKIKACRFTGASLTGEKLDEVLKTICGFNNASYQTRDDGSIIIDGPGCNNQP
jgi:transmembrane sensor